MLTEIYSNKGTGLHLVVKHKLFKRAVAWRKRDTVK